MTHDTSLLGNAELMDATRALLRRSSQLDAQLLIHLGELDARKLYLELAFSSMFQLCVDDLGMSEDVACSRIDLARLARRLPLVLDFVQSGRVHLTGLRLLAPHLTEENHRDALAAASGKS